MKELSRDEAQRLLSAFTVSRAKRQSGESDSPRLNTDSPDTIFCPHCGACEDPEHCVWSIQCPECYAPPHQQCTNQNGGFTTLHEERHRIAQSPYWRHYVSPDDPAVERVR